MDGMTRAQVDGAEKSEGVLGSGPPRPRDAATLLLLDRSGGDVRVLMGRRHARHAFMPGKFVFPGGRTDPDDSRIRTMEGLHPSEEAKLRYGPRPAGISRVRAIALSAVRETYEEAGLLIGQKSAFSTTKSDWQAFAEHGVHPSLEGIRFVARAITPPGRVRRFDTRFLAIWRDSVAVALDDGGPTNELEELVWVKLAEAKHIDVPTITRTILADVEQRLAHDPALSPGGPVPYYRMVGNTFTRAIL